MKYKKIAIHKKNTYFQNNTTHWQQCPCGSKMNEEEIDKLISDEVKQMKNITLVRKLMLKGLNIIVKVMVH